MDPFGLVPVRDCSRRSKPARAKGSAARPMLVRVQVYCQLGLNFLVALCSNPTLAVGEFALVSKSDNFSRNF
jgi:hypothetical protein